MAAFSGDVSPVVDYRNNESDVIHSPKQEVNPPDITSGNHKSSLSPELLEALDETVEVAVSETSRRVYDYLWHHLRQLEADRDDLNSLVMPQVQRVMSLAVNVQSHHKIVNDIEHVVDALKGRTFCVQVLLFIIVILLIVLIILYVVFSNLF